MPHNSTKLKSILFTAVSVLTIIFSFPNHWMIALLGLEFNTLSAHHILNAMWGRLSGPTAIKYISTQLLATMIIAVSCFCSTNQWDSLNPPSHFANILIFAALAIKLSLGPFNHWEKTMIKGSTLTDSLTLLICHKLPPFLFLLMLPSHLVFHPFLLFGSLSIVYSLCFIPECPRTFYITFLTMTLSGVTLVVPFNPLVAGCLLASLFISMTFAFTLYDPFLSWHRVFSLCSSLPACMWMLLFLFKYSMYTSLSQSFSSQAWLVFKHDFDSSLQIFGSLMAFAYLVMLSYLLLVGALIKIKTVRQFTEHQYRLMVFAFISFVLTALYIFSCLFLTP